MRGKGSLKLWGGGEGRLRRVWGSFACTAKRRRSGQAGMGHTFLISSSFREWSRSACVLGVGHGSEVGSGEMGGAWELCGCWLSAAA